MRTNSSYSPFQNQQQGQKSSKPIVFLSPSSMTNISSKFNSQSSPSKTIHKSPTLSHNPKLSTQPDVVLPSKPKIHTFLRHTTYLTKGQSLTDKLSFSTETSTHVNKNIKQLNVTDFRSTVHLSPNAEKLRRYKTYGKQQYDAIASKVHQTTSYIEELKKARGKNINQQTEKKSNHNEITSYELEKTLNFKKKKQYNLFTPKPEPIISNQKFKRGFTPNINIKNSISPRKKAQGTAISDFMIGKVIGGGKFGTVFQAFDIRTKTVYALKKVPKKMIKQYKMENQFCLEIKLQAFLNHENILKLYGVFDDDENIYLILEFMEEGNLYGVLKKNKKLPETQVSIKLAQIAKAIHHLHQNRITHRDIKPQNIVISNGVCKLCDFGWATFCDQRRKTYCGTFDYAAPQVLEGFQYDISVDIWCLGILAYELLMGKSPFYHASRKQTIQKIINVQTSKIQYPSTLSQTAISFIESLLKKKPEDRLSIDQVVKHPFLKLGENSF